MKAQEQRTITSLHETQKEVAGNNYRYRVVCCGRQWGKSTFAIMEMVAFAYSKTSRVVYFATTFDQARNIAWAYLKNQTKLLWVKEPNESRLELQIRNQEGGISEISLRGFENIETARGQQFDFLVIDEVAYMNNWKYAWEAILEPTLIFRKGQALFLSTPNGFNFFYDMFNEGQLNNSLWKSWRFTSYDNPFLDKEWLEKIKERVTEEYFQQEYMADFRSAVGKAHKEWDRNIHLIGSFDIPKSWQYVRGFDFGSSDNTASVRAAIKEHGDHQDWFIDRCYKNNRSTTSEHADVIIAQDYEKGFIPKWGDPTGAQWFRDMERYKVYIMPASKEMKQANKTWIENCVERVNELLKPRKGHKLELPNGTVLENAPHFFVFNTKENMEFVKEIEALKWRETRTGDTIPILDNSGDTNGHFDLMAALRYLAVSFKPQGKFSGGVPYDASHRKWGVYSPDAYK